MPSHKGPFNQASVWFDPASGASDTNVEPGDVNGTSESVAAGGTPSAHTFSAFTGDTSEIASYSSYMTNAIGSTGAAGSGLGPYTYTGHSDGNAFTHVLKALNSSGDIIGVAWHSVGLGSTGTGSWVVKSSLDFRNSDALTLTIGSSATLNNLQKSSSTYQAVYCQAGGTVNSTFTAGTSGIAMQWNSGTSGYPAMSWDALPHMGITAPATAADFEGMWAFQALVSSVSWPGANAERFHFYLSNSNVTPLNASYGMGVTIMDDGTNADLGIYSGSDKTVDQNTVQNTDYLMTIIMINGVFAEGWIDIGGTAFADPRSESNGRYLMYRSLTTGTMPVRYTTNLWVGLSQRRKIDGVVKQWRCLKFE